MVMYFKFMRPLDHVRIAGNIKYIGTKVGN